MPLCATGVFKLHLARRYNFEQVRSCRLAADEHKLDGETEAIAKPVKPACNLLLPHHNQATAADPLQQSTICI